MISEKRLRKKLGRWQAIGLRAATFQSRSAGVEEKYSKRRGFC